MSAFRPRGGRKEARQRRNRRRNPDGTMTLIEHLYELRHRLGLAMLAILAGGVLGFLWFNYRVGPIPSLGHLMTGPYCDLPPTQRVQFNGQPCQLLQTKPFEAFMIQLKVGIAAGAVLVSPVWFYQIWAFIMPGLLPRERKFARVFVAAASVLFAGGAVVAYMVVPAALAVLTNFGGSQFATALAGNEYVSFILTMLIIFGVSFELPLLVVMLNLVGILPYDNLRRWRRGITLALFVFAAVVTPGGDAISMLALAVTLTLLFEFSIQIARIHDRRKARRRVAEGWDGLDDNEASPLDDKPEPVHASGPLEERPRERYSGDYDDVT
jgi:sec-independent protein translocase protein TatC